MFEPAAEPLARLWTRGSHVAYVGTVAALTTQLSTAAKHRGKAGWLQTDGLEHYSSSVLFSISLLFVLFFVFFFGILLRCVFIDVSARLVCHIPDGFVDRAAGGSVQSYFFARLEHR